MTSYAAKLGALVAAGALIATVAIPAYAVVGSAAAVTGPPATVQTASVVTSVALIAPSRDGYSVTKPPPVVIVAAAGKAPVANRFAGVTVNPPAPSYSGAAVLAYAAQFVGVVPYGTGNSPQTSFSCDGFTQYVFAGFGISLPRGADHQARLGVSISKADAVAGDLVYWPGQHVGIYDGAGGMYNSPRPGRYVEHVGSLWGSPLFIRLTV
ncbi:NlpC/P60 family protein [Glaciihabitans sp. INWT7]|uniref:C40 family peptidase n=1 Tax=Glaciihabitans sp. INWT7 TaxID=2596912 RepID=UPI001628594F|nr:NlpC/P60 family protein [Glaciihabitans sp. INWT7]QNE45740.1 NlpC/P60 family protein [Glaciihabitans sp. INWT7]